MESSVKNYQLGVRLIRRGLPIVVCQCPVRLIFQEPLHRFFMRVVSRGHQRRNSFIISLINDGPPIHESLHAPDIAHPGRVVQCRPPGLVSGVYIRAYCFKALYHCSRVAYFRRINQRFIQILFILLRKNWFYFWFYYWCYYWCYYWFCCYYWCYWDSIIPNY